MTDQQTEPKFIWTRTAAFIALANMCALAWFRPDTPDYVYWVLLSVVFIWGAGSNGRMALVEAVARWRK